MIETPRFARLQAAFHEVSELPTEDREEAIRHSCGGDLAFAFELRALLAASRRADSPLDVPLLEQPREEVPGYRLLKRIGRGGSATVYLADQQGEGFTRRVALKIVDRGPDSLRFRAEQKILATLEHPGIARLYDAGITPSGRPYLVMELVRGENLIESCRQAGTPLRERLHLFLAVLVAVEHAHGAGVVHRDLKPGNILVSDRGEPKLVDFGIARLQGMETTHTQHAAMTLAYASPEQVRGEPAGVPSDIYSLGVVLYELLTGRRPYQLSDASVETLARTIREQEPEKPSAACRELRGDLRGDLDAILLKALRKEPGQRYASAADFAADLERHLEGRPVLARRGSLLYRVGRAARCRQPLLLNLALAALLLAGAWSWIYRNSPVAAPPPNAPPWLAVPVRTAALESYHRGLAARARHDIREALRHLRAAVAADPRNPLVRAALADVLSFASRDAEAAWEGQRARALTSAAPLPRESRLLIESVALRTAERRDEEVEILRSLRLLRPDDLETGLLFVRSLMRNGDMAKAQEVTAQLRALPPPRGRDLRIGLLELEILNAMGRMQDLHDRAPAFIAQAKERGFTSGMARALLAQSNALDGLGETEGSWKLAEQGRRLFLERGEAGGVARALGLLCSASLRASRYEQAERECGEGLRLNRRLGSSRGVARALNLLGVSRRRRGLLQEARAAFAEGLSISRRLGDSRNESRFLNNLALVDQQSGRLPEAEESFRKTITLKRELYDQRGLALSLEGLGKILLKRGSLGEAEALLAEAESTSRDLGAQRELALILLTRAELAGLQGKRKQALEWLDEIAALHVKGDALENLALVRAIRAQLDEPHESAACRRLEAAARELQVLGDQNAPEVWIWSARCWNEAGSPRRASSWLDLAARDPMVPRLADARIQLALARADHDLRGRRWLDAERRLDETASECRRLSHGTLLLEARLLQARLARARGDHPERVRTLAEELQRDARAADFGRIARLAGELL